jgi:hypothetical protein
VVYVPDDPRINRPVSAESSSASDSTGGLVVGVVLIVGGALWLGWLIGREILAPPPAAISLPAASKSAS